MTEVMGDCYDEANHQPVYCQRQMLGQWLVLSPALKRTGMKAVAGIADCSSGLRERGILQLLPGSSVSDSLSQNRLA